MDGGYGGMARYSDADDGRLEAHLVDIVGADDRESVYEVFRSV